jgi:tRNA(His) 5'-end guanylyltransferase
MLLTAMDLLTKFNCSAVYTASDELSMVFAPSGMQDEHLIYSGRLLKIVSLSASYAAVRFNHHLQEEARIRGEEFQNVCDKQRKKEGS